MRSFIRIAIFFYVIVIMATGLSILFALAHLTDLSVYFDALYYVYEDPQAGTITAAVVAAIMLLSYIFARIIYGRQEQKRTISFENTLGSVTIALSALEDMVRRLIVNTPQIKEIRPNITTSKRGLAADIRLVLSSEVNISDLTEDLQERVKTKIQDVIGKEEKIVVRVHVVKISHAVSGSKKKDAAVSEGGSDDEHESPLHFHGYRA